MRLHVLKSSQRLIISPMIDDFIENIITLMHALFHFAEVLLQFKLLPTTKPVPWAAATYFIDTFMPNLN